MNIASVDPKSLFDCQDGDEDKVDRILESGEVGVNAADESGITAAQVSPAPC